MMKGRRTKKTAKRKRRKRRKRASSKNRKHICSEVNKPHYFIHSISFLTDCFYSSPAGVSNSHQRLVPFSCPTKEFGLQDIIEEYCVAPVPIDWKPYAIFEGLDPRKRQAFALVRFYYVVK